ncbi:MAG: CPBP family intramembrane metalloprotease [Deltaproteobacteria bacterium]|nr:CPBP family intramembrane metalloprotease [Deltaproteobacteria bacterium]MBW2537793.1 CPBP family intramembrane metalloprotease [Deltaproteobacteria bacterium]
MTATSSPPPRAAPATMAAPPVGFSLAVSAACLGYTATTCALWYAFRGTWFGRSETVPVLFAGGAVLFFGCIWLKERVAPWRLGRETITVALTSVSLLALFWYFGRQGVFRSLFPTAGRDGGLAVMLPFFCFVAASLLARSILPMATARVVLGRSPADYGYRLRGTFELWWLYAAAAAIAAVAVVVASSLPAFQQRYPIGRNLIHDGQIALGEFVVYQLAYGLLFASGESFWRGYILFGLERRLGRLALIFMVGLYTTVHLGKPPLETAASVGAGLFLGYLALRHRSFWLGVAVHWFVALLMDLLALVHRGVTWG